MREMSNLYINPYPERDCGDEIIVIYGQLFYIYIKVL